MDIPTRVELTRIVRDAVECSGVFQAFRNLPDFDIKSDNTPVTALDYAIQTELFDRVKQYDLMLIGEEGSRFNSEAKFALAVDPLDGTGAFIRGIPTSTCVATILEKRGSLWFPIIAVIQELRSDGYTWSAEEDGRTYFTDFDSPEEVCVIPRTLAPYQITIATWPGVPFGLDKVVDQLDYSELQNQSFGSIALGAGLIASSGTDATVFAGKSALETVAMMLVVRGVGGIASDVYGRPLTGFELGLNKTSGEYDFILPNGAIMANNHGVQDRIIRAIRTR